MVLVQGWVGRGGGGPVGGWVGGGGVLHTYFALNNSLGNLLI